MHKRAQKFSRNCARTHLDYHAFMYERTQIYKQPQFCTLAKTIVLSKSQALQILQSGNRPAQCLNLSCYSDRPLPQSGDLAALQSRKTARSLERYLAFSQSCSRRGRSLERYLTFLQSCRVARSRNRNFIVSKFRGFAISQSYGITRLQERKLIFLRLHGSARLQKSILWSDGPAVWPEV